MAKVEITYSSYPFSSRPLENGFLSLFAPCKVLAGFIPFWLSSEAFAILSLLRVAGHEPSVAYANKRLPTQIVPLGAHDRLMCFLLRCLR